MQSSSFVNKLKTSVTKKKAANALGWSTTEQVSIHGISFLFIIILARLLTPTDFGIIALLAVFMALVKVIVDGGVAAALIQKEKINRVDESTLFWFNLAAGAALTLLLFLAAPLFAWFFEVPELKPITRLLSLQFILGAATTVPNNLFTRKLSFKTPFKINLSANLTGGIAAIIIAAQGGGVWALVWQLMITSLVQTALFWKLSQWRPLMVFSKTSFRNLFSYGGYFFLAQTVNVAYREIYALLVGKFFGVYELGLFSRASKTKQFPTQTLGGVLNRVAFPIFSRSQNNLPRLLSDFRLAIRGIMFFNIPFMLGLSVMAEPVIIALYGEAWRGAAPVLTILALTGVIWPLHLLNVAVIQALGYSGKYLGVELTKKGINFVLLLIGLNWGISGMAWAMVISSLISLNINAHFTNKYLHHGLWLQLKDILPCAGCAALMAFVLGRLIPILKLPHFFDLFLLSALGTLIYFGLTYLLRVREFGEAQILLAPHLLKLEKRLANYW